MGVMAGKESTRGPTAGTVATNVRSVRQGKRLNYTEVSDRLSRPISAVGVRRVEAEERRVDLDDLMDFAVALEVSPITLLMPASNSGDMRVTATATGELAAEELLAWMRGDGPLSTQHSSADWRTTLPNWWVEEELSRHKLFLDQEFELVRLREERAALEARLATQEQTIAAQAELIQALRVRGDD